MKVRIPDNFKIFHLIACIFRIYAWGGQKITPDIQKLMTKLLQEWLPEELNAKNIFKEIEPFINDLDANGLVTVYREFTTALKESGAFKEDNLKAIMGDLIQISRADGEMTENKTALIMLAATNFGLQSGKSDTKDKTKSSSDRKSRRDQKKPQEEDEDDDDDNDHEYAAAFSFSTKDKPSFLDNKSGKPAYPGEFYFETRKYDMVPLQLKRFPRASRIGELLRKFDKQEVQAISDKIRVSRTIPLLRFVQEIFEDKNYKTHRPFWFMPFVIAAEKVGCFIYLEESGLWGNFNDEAVVERMIDADAVTSMEYAEGFDDEEYDDEDILKSVSTIRAEVDEGFLTLNEFHGEDSGSQMQILEAIWDLWKEVIEYGRGSEEYQYAFHPYDKDYDGAPSFMEFDSWEELLIWAQSSTNTTVMPRGQGEIDNIIKSYVTNAKQNIYISPHIDQNKLSNFLHKIKQEFQIDIPANSVLVYFDETLLGSGDKGVALTSDKLLCYIPLDFKGILALSNIESVGIKGLLGKTISITTSKRQHVKFTLTQGNKGAEVFADILNEYLSKSGSDSRVMREQEATQINKQDKPRTLLDDMVMFYTIAAAWECKDENMFSERMDKVVEKLLEWPLEAVKSREALADSCMTAYNVMCDEGEKSEDNVFDMNRRCANRIKEHFPPDQLETIVSDIEEISISASEREIETIKAMAAHFGVNSKYDKIGSIKGVDKPAATKGKKTKEGVAKKKSYHELIYETNAVSCGGSMLSFIFSHKRMAELGLIEPDDDYEHDIDEVDELNLDIIEALKADIEQNGKIPFFVFDDEDDENAWQKNIYLDNSEGDVSSIEDIYESVGYPSKRGPFFFGNYFVINNAFETSVIFTQDGFITFHPQGNGEWLLLPWESFRGTQLVTKENSSEPIIHFLPGQDDLGLGSAGGNKNTPACHHESVILLMNEIIDQIWECVEANRDSETQEIPMNKFHFITSENIGDYAVGILNKAGIKSTKQVGESKTKTQGKSEATTQAKEVSIPAPGDVTYRKKVKEALADGVITDLERTGLDFFQKKLKLSDDDTLRIFEEVLAEIQVKPEGRAVKTRTDDAKKVVVEESISEEPGEEDDGGERSRKKRITYANWSDFEKEQGAKDVLKKANLPIANKIHDLIITVLEENNRKYEIRYGDGTFSFSIPREEAKSGKRTFARVGLLSLADKIVYLDTLYKVANDAIPTGGIPWRKNDNTQYVFRIKTIEDFEILKDSIREGVMRSYNCLAISKI